MLEPWLIPDRLEAGCDEAGRGCLAGPVTAAAVILSPDFAQNLVQDGRLNDSKKMTARLRGELRKTIEANALAWAVTHVSPKEIDEINILNASLAAMRRSVRKLHVAPEHLLIDGNRFVTSDDLPSFDCIIKGDGRYASIAAASVLAKTHRDELMTALHYEFPVYGWDRNAGYPTKQHRNGIVEHGLTIYHRQSFRQLPSQPSLFD